MSFGDNIYDPNFNQSNDVLNYILLVPQYKIPNVNFADNVDLAKGANNDEFFYDILELDTRKFDNYNGFYKSPSANPFGNNYVYTATHQLMSSSPSISAIIPADYTIASMVRYYINGFSGCNHPVGVNKLRRLFLFQPDNIVMNTL